MAASPGPITALDRQRHGRKLERYGRLPLHPPRAAGDVGAAPRANGTRDGEFVPGSDEEGGGRWQFARQVPREGWPLAWDEVRFTAQCTPFRHLGFFPDMAPVWDWMRERALGGTWSAAAGGLHLNLFGYTGVGTLALATRARDHPCRCHARNRSPRRASNAALSGMADRPIRWLVDDAAKFAAREVRRGRRYDGIILDPPKFGRGPEGEVWRLEEGLPALIADCRRLLDDESAASCS